MRSWFCISRPPPHWGFLAWPTKECFQMACMHGPHQRLYQHHHHHHHCLLHLGRLPCSACSCTCCWGCSFPPRRGISSARFHVLALTSPQAPPPSNDGSLLVALRLREREARRIRWSEEVSWYSIVMDGSFVLSCFCSSAVFNLWLLTCMLPIYPSRNFKVDLAKKFYWTWRWMRRWMRRLSYYMTFWRFGRGTNILPARTHSSWNIFHTTTRQSIYRFIITQHFILFSHDLNWRGTECSYYLVFS
jgi:hypothetical protein